MALTGMNPRLQRPDVQQNNQQEFLKLTGLKRAQVLYFDDNIYNKLADMMLTCS